MANRQYPEPLRLSGALDQFKHEETTPVIGREYLDVNIVDDLLNAKNSDERLRDLAITSNTNPWSFDSTIDSRISRRLTRLDPQSPNEA